MHIRTFRKNDLDSVLELWLSGNREAHSFIPSSYWEAQLPMVREAMQTADILVCEHRGSLIGFGGLTNAYLAGIFVSAGARSRGAGKKLLDAAKQCREEITLHVYEKNCRAIEFYLREGFALQQKAMDENTGETELFMKWKKDGTI